MRWRLRIFVAGRLGGLLQRCGAVRHDALAVGGSRCARGRSCEQSELPSARMRAQQRAVARHWPSVAPFPVCACRAALPAAGATGGGCRGQRLNRAFSWDARDCAAAGERLRWRHSRGPFFRSKKKENQVQKRRRAFVGMRARAQHCLSAHAQHCLRARANEARVRVHRARVWCICTVLRNLPIPSLTSLCASTA